MFKGLIKFLISDPEPQTGGGYQPVGKLGPPAKGTGGSGAVFPGFHGRYGTANITISKEELKHLMKRRAEERLAPRDNSFIFERDFLGGQHNLGGANSSS